MKPSFLLLACWAAFASLSGSAQYSMTVEAHAVDGVPGTTTYRFYVNVPDPSDFVTSLFGSAEDYLEINTPNGFYNSAAATGAAASGINPFFYSFFPDLAYDSWFTIGIESSPQGNEVSISSIEDDTSPWIGNFDASSPNSGNDVLIGPGAGGAWYVTNGTPNGLPDDNMRVLVLQITSDGPPSGTINAQILPLGNGDNEARPSFDFDGVGTYFPAGSAIGGCTDSSACNYNSSATSDDGSCTYPDSIYDCNGDCINDADGDGVCDSEEVAGCTDSAACNYDTFATDDDGSCTYSDGTYDCNGDCINDTDGDGICDEVVVSSEYSLTVEAHAVDGVAGTTTYRFYVNVPNPSDFVTSLFGSAEDYLEINTPNGFYNSAAATGAAASGINPFFYSFFPDLAYDSWFTIGIESSPQGNEVSISSIEDDTYPWIGNFDASSPNSGNDVLIGPGAGGAWYVTNGTPNGLPDDNMRVLVLQITSDGPPSGTINAQILPLGDGDNDARPSFDFDGVGTFYPAGSAVGGCTDSGALNYNPSATEDDGSCSYELTLATGAESFYVCDLEFATSEFEAWLSSNGGASAVGGCSDLTWTHDYDSSLDYYCTGEQPEVVVFTATDDCGNSVSDTATLVLGDFAAPVIDVEASDAMVTCDGTELTVLEDWLASAGGAQAHDLCGSVIWQHDYSGLSDDGSGISSATVTFSASDDCGNVSTTTAQFQVQCVPAGCTDSSACNYDDEALEDDGSCFYPQATCEVCDGNGGTIIQDADSDGICDLDEVLGCTDSMACNFNAQATDEDGSCEFEDAVGVCGGDCLSDTNGNGICDSEETTGTPGCMNEGACNYNPGATEDDGSCDFTSCLGCMDNAACNYDPEATIEFNGCCYYPPAGSTCDGTTTGGNDGGCTDSSACNYDSEAIEDDGSCEYCSCTNVPTAPEYSMTIEEYAVDGIEGMTTYRFYVNMANADDFLSSVYGNDVTEFHLSTGGAGFYNDAAATGGSAGGISPAFFNPPYSDLFPGLAYDSWYTIGIEHAPVGSQTSISAVESESQPWIGAFDATNALSGQDISMTDMAGGAWYVLNGTPNGLPDATNQRVLFMQLTTAGTVSGVLNTQVFLNGNGADDLRMAFVFDGPGTYGALIPETVSDECGCTDSTALNYDANAIYDNGSCIASIPGCTDSEACNYDSGANTDDGSCTYEQGGYDCDGNCLVDTDGDGVCDPNEVAGCMNCSACNFNPAATDEDGSCTFADTGYTCDGECINDADGDGVCDFFEILGCTDASACNYNASATDSGQCEYPSAGYNCDGQCVNDVDGDGVCDEFEIAGCMDCTACNFNPSVTDDDGSCSYPQPGYDCGGNCVIDSDGDGVCNAFEVVGCTVAGACNYDASATDSGTCIFAELGYDCAGDCISDADGDGVCDEFEVAGCTDHLACNYADSATDEDGSCAYATPGYDCDGDCILDSDGDGICNGFEVVGCFDSAACNFNPAATDSGACLYPDTGYDCNENCLNDADGDGVCDEFEVVGCDDVEAVNYQPLVTDGDADLCLYPDDFQQTCYDFTGDGFVGTADLLNFLQQIGSFCD